MNLDALLQPGALPWSPNPGVSGLDVWNAYEQPLTGTFLSGAQPVLFTIIADYEGRMSLWAYTCLTDDEAQDLAKAEFDSVPEMREAVARIFQGRKVALALAADNQIRQWSVPDEPGDIRDLAASFIRARRRMVGVREHAGVQGPAARPGVREDRQVRAHLPGLLSLRGQGRAEAAQRPRMDLRRLRHHP